MTGYLTTGAGEVAFLQWQVGGAGDLTGTDLAATEQGTPPGAQVVVNRGPVSGQISGSSVTLYVNGHSDTGTLEGDTLTLNVVQQDGSIRPFTYRRGSADDYNKALAALNAQTQQDNANGQHANDTAAAIQTLADDSEKLNSAINALANDQTSAAQGASGADSAAATTLDDERKVLNEAGSVDTATLCYAASNTAYAATNTDYASSTMQSTVQTATDDVAAARSLATTLANDLTAITQLEPAYQGSAHAPAPDAVHQQAGLATTTASSTVSTVNNAIDTVNADVAAAHDYAAKADAAGNCASPAPTPPPLGHIS